MDGVVVLVNDGGIDDLVDGANLVGLGNWVGLLDLNGVGLGDVGLVDNLSLDWDWVWDWDIDGVPVDLELGFDASHLGGDLGVSPDWGEDLLLLTNLRGNFSLVKYSVDLNSDPGIKLLRGGLASLARGDIGTQLKEGRAPMEHSTFMCFRVVPGWGRVAGFSGCMASTDPTTASLFGSGRRRGVKVTC